MAVNFEKDFRPPLFIDTLVVITTFALVCFSVVMVYSTTGVVSQEKFGDGLFFVKRQVGNKIGYLKKTANSFIGIVTGLSSKPGEGPAIGF